MSHPGDERSKTHIPISGDSPPLDPIAGDKPDTKDFRLGSPVTPLRAPRAAITSSSSSSDAGANKSHSGELSRSTESSPTTGDGGGTSGCRNPRPGHRRSCSNPLMFSTNGGAATNSPVSASPAGVLPAGNICPSGKVVKVGMMPQSSPRRDVLGSGTGNYGHGSIMRGSGGKSSGDMPRMEASGSGRRAMASVDPEEVTRAGNEQYRKGLFTEAIKLYSQAIAMCPDSAACRSNKAAALMGLGRSAEAVRECEEALRVDPSYVRAHQRLASLFLRLGQVENARHHASKVLDPTELQKFQAIERYLSRCADARRIGDWKSALRESDAAIAAGADSSHLLLTLKAEAFLQLHRLDEADLTISRAVKLEALAPTCLHFLFCGMSSTSYLHMVRAQVEMSMGRFENAELSANRARESDPQNKEILMVGSNVKNVIRARSQGNELFNSGKFVDACSAYGEGLNYDPFNPVLYCNRAVCHSKLGRWEKSVEDCNEALKFHPRYTKALLRRATSYGKLERWTESVRDYEILRKELPHDNDVAEALVNAEDSLKNSRKEGTVSRKPFNEAEEIMDVERFRDATSSPGIYVVQFMATHNQLCNQMAPFMDVLCVRYRSLNFLKINVDKSPAIAKAENVNTVPTFKIYKNGTSLTEMICPSQHALECTVRHYVMQ